MTRAAPGLHAIVVAVAVAAALAGGCADDPAQTSTTAVTATATDTTAMAASPQLRRRGAVALREYGCGACHRIPAVHGAAGVVGPPLVDMGQRVYIARGLPNTAHNMMRFIQTPQQFAPGSAMPDMQVSAADAQAITAYLYHGE